MLMIVKMMAEMMTMAVCDDDEDYEESQNEPLSFLSDLRSSRSNQSTSVGGPSGGPPRNIPARGPPRSVQSSNSKGPIKSRNTPPSNNSRLEIAKRGPQKAKRIKSNEVGGKKVRKAKLDVDMDIFEGVDSGDRDTAIEWVVKSFKDKRSEREILMELQGNGWNAPQSRAIINLGKNR